MSEYEGKMARASLRKTAAYANELLGMIKPDDNLEPWVQNKINDLDHYIEAVYGYYKFGEANEDEMEDEMDEANEMVEMEGITINLTPASS